MPATYTGAALTALILQCAEPNVPVAVLTDLVMVESGGDHLVTHTNSNGTIDYGLAQINSTNLAWLGLTPATALDPCKNIEAASRYLTRLSRYNTGSPTAGFYNGYVQKVLARRSVDIQVAEPAPAPAPQSTTTGTWDIHAPASGTQFVFTQKGSP